MEGQHKSFTYRFSLGSELIGPVMQLTKALESLQIADLHKQELLKGLARLLSRWLLKT